jgi:uncharacterized protein YbaP (TraB family)
MKKTQNPVLLIILFLLAAALSTPRVSAREADTGKHYIWRVINAPAPFYLVGSVHSLRGSDYPLAKPIMDAFHEVRNVVFEYNPHEDEEFTTKFEEASKLPKGQTIYTKLHPQTLKFLETRFRNSNYHFDQVKDWKAWRIAAIWGISGWSNWSGAYGVDSYLYYHCRRLGKAVGGLESIDEHVSVLGDMTDAESEVMLLDDIVQGDKRRDSFNRAVAAWKRGDPEGIWADERRFRQLAPTISSRLLDMRNLKWVPRIIGMIKSGQSTMVVAGAAHFAGPPSLIKLLAVHGYKCEQL